MRTRDKQRLARHIVDTWNQATPHEVQDGLRWYREARSLAESLDPSNPRKAAAVIAVLSPLTSWTRNVDLAVDAYAGRPLGCLSSNASKAQRILSGEDPDQVVKGSKVRAFWRAITDPSDGSAIVIDRHAVEVAFGKVMSDDQREKILSPKGGYDSVCQRYAVAAGLLSDTLGRQITPVDVQAVTWVTWRRLKKGFVRSNAAE